MGTKQKRNFVEVRAELWRCDWTCGSTRWLQRSKVNLWRAVQKTCSSSSRICQHKNSSSKSNSTKTGTTIRRTWRWFFIVLIQKQDGNNLLQPPRILLHPGGNHPTAGRKHGIGTLQHGMRSRIFCSRCENFSVTENSDSLASDGEVYTEHLVARIFLTRTVCQVVLSGSYPSLTFHALAWLRMKLCAFSKTVHISRNMSYITPELTSTFSPCTRTPSSPSARPTSTSSTFHSGEINPCHDPEQASIGYMADVRTSTGYEPKDLVENDGSMRQAVVPPQTENNFDLRFLPRALRRLLLNRIWMLSKIVLFWLHHCSCRREKQVRTDHKFITL